MDVNVIDIDRQMLDLFDREQMLAFFDFFIPRDGSSGLQGLCKISKPKKTESRVAYFSLLFIIDTEEEGSNRHADKVMRGIQWNNLRNSVPQVQETLVMPPSSTGKDNYIIEITVYLRTTAETVTRKFIREKVYPAILGVSGFRGGELSFWDETAEQAEPVPKPRELPVREEDKSLIGRLLRFLGA